MWGSVCFDSVYNNSKVVRFEIVKELVPYCLWIENKKINPQQTRCLPGAKFVQRAWIRDS